MYVLGMDVGGTKTHCAIADEGGQIIGEGFGGKGNYQICGIEIAIASWKMAMRDALAASKIEKKDIKFAVLGMSGADDESDFAILNPAVEKVLKGITFEIYHDSWIGLSSVSEDNVGVVSICGTGAGHAGRNYRGDRVVLRNLDYILGNYGGGEDLVDKTLHYAFRSNEATFTKSSLEEAVVEVFQANNMDEVCTRIREQGITDEQAYKLPIVTFREADRGDCVAKMLISNMGKEEGMYAASVIRKLGLEKDQFPVVLVGGLFATNNPILINSFLEEVHLTAPKAYSLVPKVPPVIGAIKLALEGLRLL